MKRLVQIVLFLVIAFTTKSKNYDTLLNRCRQLIDKKVPTYQNTTIDGKFIDSSYFMGKITLLSFFAFGCGPCYHELSLLSELSKTNKYQILLLGDATEKDLCDFRGYRSKSFRKTKRKLGIDTLAFDIIADCPENAVRFFSRSCKGSAETFKIFAYPTTFFINQEGIIKEICTGFAVPRNKTFDEYFYAKLKEAEK